MSFRLYRSSSLRPLGTLSRLFPQSNQNNHHHDELAECPNGIDRISASGCRCTIPGQEEKGKSVSPACRLGLLGFCFFYGRPFQLLVIKRSRAGQHKSNGLLLSITISFHSVEISLPLWLYKYEASLKDKEFKTDEEMMEVAIEISAKNVEHDTGGPFGTAIYERCKQTGTTKLVAVGANRVTALNNSTLHGETVAIQMCQKKLNTFSLRQTGNSSNKEYILCTSCEPCCMCLGATLWSGVDVLMCSASKSDAEAIGFNEGPVFDESYLQLEQSGCKVKRQVLQEKGAKVLNDYAKTGVIY